MRLMLILLTILPIVMPSITPAQDLSLPVYTVRNSDEPQGASVLASSDYIQTGEWIHHINTEVGTSVFFYNQEKGRAWRSHISREVPGIWSSRLQTTGEPYSNSGLTPPPCSKLKGKSLKLSLCNSSSLLHIPLPKKIQRGFRKSQDAYSRKLWTGQLLWASTSREYCIWWDKFTIQLQRQDSVVFQGEVYLIEEFYRSQWEGQDFEIFPGRSPVSYSSKDEKVTLGASPALIPVTDIREVFALLRPLTTQQSPRLVSLALVAPVKI